MVRYPSLPAATYPEFALAVPWAPAIGRLVRRLDFDVFHAHHPFLLGPVARRLARRCGRPLVFTYHTRYEKYAHYVPFVPGLVGAAAVALSTPLCGACDAVIAPSALIRDELRGRGVRTPIAVVPTGVDLARFRPGDRGRPGRPGSRRAGRRRPLRGASRSREERGSRASSRSSAWRARCRERAWCWRARAPRARVSGRPWRGAPWRPACTFLGVLAHEALPPVYRAADVFLFASETETQGLVLAEAAACGLPAVAVSAPGCDEVVRDGETGLLTKREPLALAEGAIGLLLDGERRGHMAERARAVAETEFDVRRQIDRTLAVYAEVRGVGGDRSRA